MYRISFTKIQFLKKIESNFISLQVETQTSQKFKLQQKKMKNNAAKFYGEFFQLQTNNLNFYLSITAIPQRKPIKLFQKILIRRNTYGLNKKASHIIQQNQIKVFFDSQIINQKNSDNSQSAYQFSNYFGNKLLSPRLNLIKQKREFSPDQKRTFKSRKSSQDINPIHSKNSSLLYSISSIDKENF